MARQGVLAILLCGGRGTRLDPLTRSETKPAVFIGGKYRLIDFSMSNLIKSYRAKSHQVVPVNALANIISRPVDGEKGSDN